MAKRKSGQDIKRAERKMAKRKEMKKIQGIPKTKGKKIEKWLREKTSLFF